MRRQKEYCPTPNATATFEESAKYELKGASVVKGTPRGADVPFAGPAPTAWERGEPPCKMLRSVGAPLLSLGSRVQGDTKNTKPNGGRGRNGRTSTCKYAFS